MAKFEEKIRTLVEERETIINELGELQKAYEIRQKRLIEISGSLHTLNELIEEDKKDKKEINDDESSNKK